MVIIYVSNFCRLQKKDGSQLDCFFMCVSQNFFLLEAISMIIL